LIAILVNMLIMGTILSLVSDRLTRQRTALGDLSDALDSAAIALVRPDGTIVHWTRGCTELYGWTDTEAVGRNKHELLQSRATEGGDPPPLSADGEAEFLERTRDGIELNVMERRRYLQRSGPDPVVVLKMIALPSRLRSTNSASN